MMGGKRILAGFLAVCLLLAMLPAAALAEEPTPTELDLSKGNITLSETSVSGFDSGGNQVTEVNPDGYRIVQSDPDVSTGNGITIGAGQVSVTLAGVNIARRGDAIVLNADARATVVLEQGTENYAKSSWNAGVYVDAKASLELSGAGI